MYGNDEILVEIRNMKRHWWRHSARSSLLRADIPNFDSWEILRRWRFAS